MLEDAGFRMIEAVNGDQALDLLAADSYVQLLFTDVNMPGTINGLALARQVRGRWPHIGIMVASATGRAISGTSQSAARIVFSQGSKPRRNP